MVIAIDLGGRVSSTKFLSFWSHESLPEIGYFWFGDQIKYLCLGCL